jgi:MoaA/NifB/PqqE/SkfB family radical SAM enzyme
MNDSYERDTLKLKSLKRRECLDLELTNRCNALCTFCPRDKTPKQGFISDEHFYKALSFAAAENITLSLTGQGESLIHPKFVEYVQAVKKLGLKCMVTSNAALLSESLTNKILEAGLDQINFSVSNLWADYDSVYNLPFETTLKNIKYFLQANNNRCVVQISIVKNKQNENKHREMRKFWMDLGIDREKIEILGQCTRAGACETDHLFINTDQFRHEARKIAEDNDILGCVIPFVFPAIGWNGNHYLCCHDYEKKDPLGSIDTIDLMEVNQAKISRVLDSDASICRKCNLDPVSQIQELLLRHANNIHTKETMSVLITRLKNRRRKAADPGVADV